MPIFEVPSELRQQTKELYAEQGHPICPRCRNGHTVRGNYMDLCDGCGLECVRGAQDWVDSGAMTQESADTLVAGIRAAAARWRAK